jgi:hypothetical protein
MSVKSFRCACGFMIEVTPQLGDSVVSSYHLHKGPRLDGGSSPVRMEEIPDLVPEREVVCVAGSQDHHEAPPAEKHHQPREKAPRPHRRAA